MVEAYGASSIYLDQLGSAEPFPCYDPTHTHRDIGDFNRGYLALLRGLRARLQQLDPNSFLMIENCGDIYSAHVWGSLTWNGEPYDEFFNLFKYTFPAFVQVNMVNPRPELSGEEKLERFHRHMERAMLLGSIFWLGLEKFADGDEVIHGYMAQAVAMRAELQPLLREATYLDDEGIHESACRSGAQLEVDAPAEAAYQLATGNIDRTAEEVQARRVGDRLRIGVPAHSLSWVLLRP